MDIRIKTSWRNHWKYLLLKSRLGAEGVLALERLWMFAAENHPRGVLRGMTMQQIACAAQYTGAADTFVETLSSPDLRLLDKLKKGTGYAIHNWGLHQPWIFHQNSREKMARKAAEKRWKMRNACGTHAERNAPSPSPSPSPSPIPIPKETARKTRHPLSASDQVGMLTALGVTEATATAYLELRKAKRAPLTQVAISRLEAEAKKADMTLEAVLIECCMRGWQGFRADWMHKAKRDDGWEHSHGR